MSTPLEEGESNRGSHNHERSDSNTSLPMTEAEAHYRSLTEFFKYLVTIVLTGIGVLIGVGLYVTNKDMSAMRAEVRQNTSDVKSELRQSLSDVKADTKTVVDSAKEDAKTAVASTIEGANFAIKGTQNAAEAQISQIRGQSATIALSEAQKRVDDAFRNRNIEGMVENAAKQQVAPVIERQLRGEVDRAMNFLRNDISYLSDLGDAASILRGGARPGLDRLVDLQKRAPNENMRLRAKTLLMAIGDDYEKVTAGSQGQAIESSLVQAALVSYAKELEPFVESERRVRLIPILIREIRTNDDPFVVTSSFLALRNLTNNPFRVFDIEAINAWCTEHAAQCQ